MLYILALATGLRLILLNQSLWLDEAIEALALRGHYGAILQYALSDFQPPLYHLIGKINTFFFGYSEIALRLPSLVCGLLTIYFVIKIGEFLVNKKVGYLAGLLAATNPLLIYYSQEGRTYMMTTFFVTASFYYFIKCFKFPSRSSSILYSLFITLTIWTSYLSWFVLLVEAVYVLYKKRYDILAFQIIAALSLILWLPSFFASLSIGQYIRQVSPEWGKVVGGLDYKSIPLTWVKFNIGRISFANKYLYAGIVSLVFILHAWILKFVDLRKNKLLLVWISPLLLGVITALFVPVYSYTRIMFVLPSYLLLLAIGLQRLPKSYTYIVIILQILFLSIFWFTPNLHRENWRQLSEELPKDVVLALPSRDQSPPLIYYLSSFDLIEPKIDELSSSPIYYIRYSEDIFDPNRLGQANFKKSGYTITKQKSYAGIQLDIYEKL